MNIVVSDPWRVCESWRNQLNFPRRAAMTKTEQGSEWQPAVDIVEDSNRYVLYLDIPGVSAKEIEVSIDKGILTVTGERSSTDTDEKQQRRRLERPRGSFCRRFSLPDDIDADGVTARGKDGVLEVVIPRMESALPRRISVTH